MNTHDARRLDHHTLTELRARAVRSVQEGQSPEIVAKALGIHRVTIIRTALPKFPHDLDGFPDVCSHAGLCPSATRSAISSRTAA